eukprot:352557-Chlamydomonas_euryale.AAC.1
MERMEGRRGAWERRVWRGERGGAAEKGHGNGGGGEGEEEGACAPQGAGAKRVAEGDGMRAKRGEACRSERHVDLFSLAKKTMAKKTMAKKTAPKHRIQLVQKSQWSSESSSNIYSHRRELRGVQHCGNALTLLAGPDRRIRPDRLTRPDRRTQPNFAPRYGSTSPRMQLGSSPWIWLNSPSIQLGRGKNGTGQHLPVLPHHGSSRKPR